MLKSGWFVSKYFFRIYRWSRCSVIFIKTMKNWLTRLFERTMEAFLRLPLLFVIDGIVKSRYGFTVDLTATLVFAYKFLFYKSFELAIPALSDVAFGLVHSFGFVSALFCLIIPIRNLVIVYLYGGACLVIFWSYVMNEEYVKCCLDLRAGGSTIQSELFILNKKVHITFFGNYFSQAALGILLVFSSRTLPNYPPRKLSAGIPFVFPSILSLIPLPPYLLSLITYFITGFEGSILLYYLVKQRYAVYYMIKNIIVSKTAFIQDNTLFHVFGHFIAIVELGKLLKIFWLARFLMNAYVFLYDAAFSQFKNNGELNLSNINFRLVTNQLLAHNCDTILAVSSLATVLSEVMICIVSCISTVFALPPFVKYARTSVFNAAFLVLAVQTGLTGLDNAVRPLRLYRNTILTVAIASSFIERDAHDRLVTLSVGGSFPLNKHVRALMSCAFLVAYSCCFLIFLHNYHSFTLWLLATSSFFVDFVIKVFFSLLLYTINMVDARSPVLWENYDKYNFYIATIFHISNWLISAFASFTGLYTLFSESFGVFRCTVIFFHMYFNMWGQLQTGWHVYQIQKTTEAMVNSLVIATAEQIVVLDDVCSICHYEMVNARITKCNHFFHASCLKKWLYDHQKCPICYKNVLHDS